MRFDSACPLQVEATSFPAHPSRANGSRSRRQHNRTGMTLKRLIQQPPPAKRGSRGSPAHGQMGGSFMPCLSTDPVDEKGWRPRFRPKSHGGQLRNHMEVQPSAWYDTCAVMFGSREDAEAGLWRAKDMCMVSAADMFDQHAANGRFVPVSRPVLDGIEFREFPGGVSVLVRTKATVRLLTPTEQAAPA